GLIAFLTQLLNCLLSKRHKMNLYCPLVTCPLPRYLRTKPHAQAVRTSNEANARLASPLHSTPRIACTLSLPSQIALNRIEVLLPPPLHTLQTLSTCNCKARAVHFQWSNAQVVHCTTCYAEHRH